MFLPVNLRKEATALGKGGDQFSIGQVTPRCRLLCDIGRLCGHLWPRRHAARYSAYLAGLALLGLSFSYPWLLAPLGAGFAAYARRCVRRVRDERPFDTRLGMAAAYALVPVVLVAGDVAKMIGYPQGLWERWRAGGAEGLADAPIAPHRAHLGGRGATDG